MQSRCGKGTSTAKGRKPESCLTRLIPFVLLSLLFTFAGCAAPKATQPGPSKQTTKRDGTSSKHYIVETGCVSLTGDAGRDRLAADQAARAEVAKRIEVKVVQLVEDIQREEGVNEQVQASYAISIQTQETVDRTLMGIKISERKTRKEEGLQCSMAVLDKAAMASRIRGEVDKLLAEVQTHLSGAEAALAQGSPADALRDYTLATLVLNQAAVEASLLRDLGYRPLSLPSRVGIWKKWMQTLQAIEVEPAGGNRQRGRPGDPLAKPLALRTIYGAGVPVANLPLKVLRAPKNGEMQVEGVTDGRGEASFLVFRAGSTGKAMEEVAVGIDWQRLLQAGDVPSEEAPWKIWDTREIVLTYSLPYAGDYRVGVAVYEAGTGRPMAGSPIQSALLEGLQKKGFKTQDVLAMSGAVGQAFRKKPTIEESCRILGKKLDILVIGEVSLGFSSRFDNDLFFYRARGMIQGITLSSGRVLATLDEEEKGGGLDETRASKKAISNLGEKLRKEVGSALVKKLE